MAKVSMSTDFAAPVEEFGTLIGSFNALSHRHPAVLSSKAEGVGPTRALALAGGASMVEKLEAVDDGRLYSYSIVSGPLPLAD